jgi:hypothetical protein
MEEYEKTIAEIDKTIDQAADRIQGLANNLNRAINVLTAANPKGLSAPQRGVLLAFEVLCVESLWRTAWLFHERNDPDSAQECLEVGRLLQEAVETAVSGS